MLDSLALNLRWSWHYPTAHFLASLDPEAWERVQGDPIALLGEITPERFAQLAADGGVVMAAQQLDDELQTYMNQPKWYQTSCLQEGKPRQVAYFSAEFGITQAMPLYSGGLGILAGDHLKAASDLGVPMTGVGLLYGAGYFKQSLTRDGWQQETYPLLDPNSLPLSLVRNEEGAPVLVSVDLPDGRVLWARIWKAQVGRVPLLLLDSNINENDEKNRKVTDRLYGGSAQHRLEQELLLGIGGVKALRAYTRLVDGEQPDVYHCNEGHAGFLAVERIRELTNGEGSLPLDAAVEAVRASTVFTTHTPVPAGIDRFDRNLVRPYLRALALTDEEVEDVLDLGKETYEGGSPHVFNMAVFALRMARAANGVSRLHGEVSRGMFAKLWPGFDVGDVPITHITNGVHKPTWRHHKFKELVQDYMTPEQELDGQAWMRSGEQGGVPSKRLWATRRDLRAGLVEAARARMRESWLERGISPAEARWTDRVLNPDVLTIGFARRVPTYKRLTLMLSDPERLTRLLTDPERPIQLVIAGKSHPHDEEGVALIQRLVQFADNPEVREHIVFLPNYDMGLAQVLLPGCDVWLNNPLRPLEASGTSGMKAALNGALNLSILDGWWEEMYDGANGWAIPTADGVEDPIRRDEIEADALYDLLENTVAPRFYERDSEDVAWRWVEMVRRSLAVLVPKVQASRMVRDYVRELYVPVAIASRHLDSEPYAAAVDLADWKNRVRSAWPGVRVGFVEVLLPDTAQLGDEVTVSSAVHLNGLEPGDVQVQMVFGRVDAEDNIRGGHIVRLSPVAADDGGGYRFAATEPLRVSGSVGFAVRVVPDNSLLASPEELGLVVNAEPAATGQGHPSS